MGEVFVLAVRETELEYLHSGIAALVEHFAYLGRDESQILGDYVQLAEFFLCKAEQFVIRAFFPFADSRILVAERNGVIAFKTAEVVNADDIVQLRSGSDTLDPPLVACFLVVFPVVERISPKLTRWREVIGRTACDSYRPALSVKFK